MNEATRRDELVASLKAEHQQSTFASYFKEVIYGALDGIVTTFAVVAGFSGAALSNETTTQLSFVIVLLFGLANLFADAASMALGNFLSVRAEQDQYVAARASELSEIQDHAEKEYAETLILLEQKGFSREDAQTLANIYQRNEEYWTDFMMNNEHEMPDPRGTNPVYTGLATFVSFIVFGSIPLMPFIVFTTATPAFAFTLSIIGTASALVVLGLLRWQVIGDRLVRSLTEVVTIGGVAALLAYGVGTFFSL